MGEAAEAHAFMEQRAHVGKIVLVREPTHPSSTLEA
jgi:hypothetical protein